MKKFFCDLFEKIKRPRAALLVCFYILFFAALAGTALLLAFSPKTSPLHYLLYALSAVGLAYFVYTLVLLAPKGKAAAVRLLRKNAFTQSILQNYGFRTLVFAAAGACANAAYVALQTAAGILLRSVWHIAVAAFYLVLIALKGGLLLCAKKYKDPEKQIKACRACGYSLSLLTLTLTGILVLINREAAHYEYPGYMIYAAAAYTFYKIVSAVMQCIRARRQDSLIVQAVRNVNLAAAVYSVLALQVALIQAFGSARERVFNAITGGVAAALILFVGVCMIVTKSK